jgi:hypothetical protein
MAATPDDGGYWIASRAGGVVACGDAIDYGSLSIVPNNPIVGIAATPDGGGYWLVATDGGIFTFGDAVFYGSTGSLHLNKPIIGMTSDNADGYWLVASDGGVFNFGDAQFHGSTGSLHLNQPMVGMAFAPNLVAGEHGPGDYAGYWLVAADGGIFGFGTANFFGSTGSLRLNAPIVGMASTPDGQGYWLVASDGGIFSFNAPFLGSTGNIVLNQPIVGMEARGRSGYRFVASDGGIFAFGTSAFLGSAVAPSPPGPVLDPGPPICTVSLSNPTPPDGGSETAMIQSTLAYVPVTVTVSYKTTTSVYQGATDGTGKAAITFGIGHPTGGYQVNVTATVGTANGEYGLATCTSSFTPQ